MTIAVRKVVVTGAPFLTSGLYTRAGRRYRSSITGQPSPLAVQIHTADGQMTIARTEDFTDTPLKPSIHDLALQYLPDSARADRMPAMPPEPHTLSFVVGPVKDRAEELLNGAGFGSERIRSRLIPARQTPINWEELPFDSNRCDAMFVAMIRHGGGWEAVPVGENIYPFETIPCPPDSVSWNYGQEAFEGLKAFQTKDGRIVLFRPHENGKRFGRAAERVGMTPVPPEYFVEAAQATVLANERLVPPYGTGAALYLRPVQIGYGGRLGVKAAHSEAFILLVSPVGPYYPGGKISGISLLAQTTFHRAGPGGTGATKVGGNYAAGLGADRLAKDAGCQGVLWLDAVTKRRIEEVGTSNAWLIFQRPDGTLELHTPPLGGTILPGITRDSLIILASRIGLAVVERQIEIDEVLDDLNYVGMFCSGTAAVLTPVTTVKDEHGGTREFPIHPLFYDLYNLLGNVQLGEAHTELGWAHVVKE